MIVFRSPEMKNMVLIAVLIAGVLSAVGGATSVSATSPSCTSSHWYGTNTPALIPSDGSPMPVCPPGKPGCNNDEFKLRAGDGSPMPV
jgi:hypothetical protein